MLSTLNTTSHTSKFRQLFPHTVNGQIELRLHEIWAVSVDDGAEGESVAKGSSHVLDFHVVVALSDVFSPLLQPLEPCLPRHSLPALAATLL